MANTFSTGNQVPSTDPRDLLDNASNLDDLLLGPLPFYPDRLGNLKRSWVGVVQLADEFFLNSGYQFIGDYDSGPLNIAAAYQVFSKDGEFWRAGPSLVLPYVTVENWAIDQANFVSVGDAVLRQELSSAGGSSLVEYNGSTVQAALDDLTEQIQGAEVVSILNFPGVVGDGIADCTVGFQAARDFVATRSAAGNTVKLTFPAGRYRYTASPNWAILRAHYDFQGEVWLINEGAGASFILDGGAVGTGVYGIQITGTPLIYGDAGTAQGVYMRAIYKSDLRFNVRGAGTAFAGLYMEWCVSNTIAYTINANEGGLFNTPSRGIHMTLRGAAEETSYNVFNNVECTGVPVGIYQDGALGNLFVGGAVQGCTNIGVQQTLNAWENKFIGTDFEVNTNGDVECNARESQFIGCDFEKGIVFQSSAVNCTVIGGATEDIVIQSGATRTLHSAVVYNRFGAGTISDAGTLSRFRDMRNKVTGEIGNTVRARTVVAVGASPFTYANVSGNDQDIIVSGGTVSSIVLTRFIGDTVSIANGQFSLSPGDSITIAYSSAPNVILRTR